MFIESSYFDFFSLNRLLVLHIVIYIRTLIIHLELGQNLDSAFDNMFV
jgi:hypothetical protein